MRVTGGDGEHIDKFKDEKFGECATEIGNTIGLKRLAERPQISLVGTNIRSQHGHICPSNVRISNPGEER